MTEQLPLTHRNDPHTSNEAEANYVASGKLEGDLGKVLALVVRWPGQTCQQHFERCVWCHEAAKIVGINCGSTGFHFAEDVYRFALLREMIKKRMRDLWQTDLVERRETPELKWQTHNGAIIYWPTSRGVLANGGKL